MTDKVIPPGPDARDNAVEAVARAIVNARKPKPFVDGMDAYGLLVDWATFDPAKAKPGTAGARARQENVEMSRRELSAAHKEAQAAISAHLAALKEQGMVVVPREPTEKMARAADVGRDNNGYEVCSQDARQVYRAMIAASEGE